MSASNRIQIRNSSRTMRMLVHATSTFPPTGPGNLEALHDLNPGERVTVTLPREGGIVVSHAPVEHAIDGGAA